MTSWETNDFNSKVATWLPPPLPNFISTSSFTSLLIQLGCPIKASGIWICWLTFARRRKEERGGPRGVMRIGGREGELSYMSCTLLMITLLNWWVVFMGPTIDSRWKTPDAGIPLFDIEYEVKTVEHNSSDE